jgi:hypothetical protein
MQKIFELPQSTDSRSEVVNLYRESMRKQIIILDQRCNELEQIVFDLNKQLQNLSANQLMI